MGRLIDSLTYSTPGSPAVKDYDPSDSEGETDGDSSPAACATCSKPMPAPTPTPDSSPSLGGIKSNAREMAPAE